MPLILSPRPPLIEMQQGRGAGAWLDVIPTSGKHALRANEFSIASNLRLGLALPFTDWVKVCDCGRDLDQQG